MDILAQIRRPIEDDLLLYKALYDHTFSHEDDLLGQMLAYVRSRQGKMMRPILVLLMAREFGAVNDVTLRAAVTLELLHTASLTHDDVVDESDERRGAASVNAVFGNKGSILTGDYMLSRALHEAALSGDLRIVEAVAKLGGTLAEGEIKQLANLRDATASEESYFQIIHNKTAALFETCALLGALSTRAPQERLKQCAEVGALVGICFQIRDDIFDYFDDPRVGKPTGSDMREGKLTLPALYALNTADTDEVRLWGQQVLERTAEDDTVRHFVEYTKECGGIEYAQGIMEQYADKARQIIATFTQLEVREALLAYVDFTLQRNR